MKREPTPTELLTTFIENPPDSQYWCGFLAACLALDGGAHPRTPELRAMLAPKTSK